jgi:hypothetical protein
LTKLFLGGTATLEVTAILGGIAIAFGPNPWQHCKNPIWSAIWSGNVSSFQALLPYYRDLDAEDEYGFTMLNYTARQGNEEMTNILLSQGAEEIVPEYNTAGEIQPSTSELALNPEENLVGDGDIEP